MGSRPNSPDQSRLGRLDWKITLTLISGLSQETMASRSLLLMQILLIYLVSKAFRPKLSGSGYSISETSVVINKLKEKESEIKAFIPDPDFGVLEVK